MSVFQVFNVMTLTVCLYFRVYLAGLVGLLLILTAEARVGNSSESSFCTETKECLLYDLVCKNDDYEVRHYDSVKWVSTDEEAYLMDKAIVTSFMRLFKYITGSNEAGVNIDMTVPVIVKIEETKRMSQSSVYTLSFVLPSAHQMTPPQPTDDKIRPNRPLHPMPYALVEI
ncbi:heme-binding protein 2-like isoform X1 [Coregonus clupeaformis]|uniref:heme-binding protein 2-like isoform X1 n=1 Tax=Coregonus clupeaformis TaxID=59861 RepID=UPI001BE0BB25|nr:heme-binding protein 2-like isoform X1 [Coregonus clupeaformis]